MDSNNQENAWPMSLLMHDQLLDMKHNSLAEFIHGETSSTPMMEEHSV